MDWYQEFRLDIAAAAKSDDPKNKWGFGEATRADAQRLRNLLAKIKHRELRGVPW